MDFPAGATSWADRSPSPPPYPPCSSTHWLPSRPGRYPQSPGCRGPLPAGTSVTSNGTESRPAHGHVPQHLLEKPFPAAGELPSPSRPESPRHQPPAGRRSRHPRARLGVAGSVSGDRIRSAKPPRVASGLRYTRGGLGPPLRAVHSCTHSPAGKSSGSSPAGGGAPSTSATASASSSPRGRLPSRRRGDSSRLPAF